MVRKSDHLRVAVLMGGPSSEHDVSLDGGKNWVVWHLLWTSALVESPELRQSIGAAGRRTIESRYSVESQKAAYSRVLRDLCKKPA